MIGDKTGVMPLRSKLKFYLKGPEALYFRFEENLSDVTRGPIKLFPPVSRDQFWQFLGMLVAQALPNYSLAPWTSGADFKGQLYTLPQCVV